MLRILEAGRLAIALGLMSVILSGTAQSLPLARLDEVTSTAEVQVADQDFEDADLFRDMFEHQAVTGDEAQFIFVNSEGVVPPSKVTPTDNSQATKALQIFIDKRKQTLVMKENGVSVFSKAIPVSTGGGVHVPKNGNPPVCGLTPSTTYRFALTKDRFFTNYFSKKYEAWVNWAVALSPQSGIYMHQAPTAGAEKIIGRPASGGCVRLRAADAKRVYEYLFRNLGQSLTVDIRGDDRKEYEGCVNSEAYKSAMRDYDRGQKVSPKSPSPSQVPVPPTRAVRAPKPQKT